MTIEYADELVSEIKERENASMRELPKLLDRALERAISNGVEPQRLPPDYNPGSGEFGYVALFQRILKRQVAPDGPASERFSPGLAVAGSELLGRKVTDVRFRGPDDVGPAPDSRLPEARLWEILGRRRKEGVLGECEYVVVAHDFRLGEPFMRLPGLSASTLPRSSDGEAESNNSAVPIVAEVEGDIGSGALAFAGLARLLAGGLSLGMRLRICIAPGLRSLQGGRGRQSFEGDELEALRSRARYRLARLIAAGQEHSDERSLLSFEKAKDLDAAAWSVLSDAEEVMAETDLEMSLESQATRTQQIVRSRFEVVLLPSAGAKPAVLEDRALKLLRALPVRILFESGPRLPDPGHNTYLWLQLKDDEVGTKSERLLHLSADTSSDIRDILGSTKELEP